MYMRYADKKRVEREEIEKPTRRFILNATAFMYFI